MALLGQAICAGDTSSPHPRIQYGALAVEPRPHTAGARLLAPRHPHALFAALAQHWAVRVGGWCQRLRCSCSEVRFDPTAYIQLFSLQRARGAHKAPQV